MRKRKRRKRSAFTRTIARAFGVELASKSEPKVELAKEKKPSQN
jgi:hypothetical protein